MRKLKRSSEEDVQRQNYWKKIKAKKFAESSLNEFKTTMKEVNYQKRKNIIIAEFLGVSVDDDIFSTKQVYPQFKMPVVCYSFSEMLEEENFVIDRLPYYYEEGDLCEVSRIQVEIDVDKTVDVVILGDYFLTKDGKKFVISVDFETNSQVGEIVIYSADENKEEASQIITALDEKILYSNFLKGKKITPFGKFLKLKKTYSWEDAIFSKKLEDEIKRNIERFLANFEIYRKNGLPTKRGILLSGAPGVGKTLLGKVLVSTIEGVTFVWVTPKYFSEGCQSGIDLLFDLATEMAPTILFMEDVDFYGVSRKYGNTSTVLGEFLNKADGLVENEGVLIIMTTNHPELLDNAIKERPGRFDRLIEILPPKEPERYKMLERFCKDLKTYNIDWEKIVHLTKGFTGALLRELIITASSFAIEDKSLDENSKVILKQKHFDQSFETLEKYSKAEKKNVSGFRREDDEIEDKTCEDTWQPTISKKTQYEKDTGVID